MSLIIDIADAVTAELNDATAGTFSEAFVAQRRVIPAFELAQLTELKVTVVPKRLDITGSTRSASQYDIAIDIGIQKKLPPGTGEAEMEVEVGRLGTVVDQIADYLRRRTLSAAPFATWISIANDPVYAPEHLLEQRVFTSVLTVTYRAIK